MEEKRKFPRYQARNSMAYYPHNDIVRFSYTTSNNISRGGVCINAISGLVHKGDIINMEINLDGRKCASVKGKVVWVKRLDLGLPSYIEAAAVSVNDEVAGIEFMNSDPSRLEILINPKKAR